MMDDANIHLDYTNRIAEEITRVLNGWEDKFKSFSYYLVLYLIAKDNNNLCIDIDFIKMKINECYFNVFKKISKASNKKIALYGRGKHTQILIRKYREILGKSLNFDVYVDTYQGEGIEEDGKRIVNIKEVQKSADIIIISSYQYRLEMIKKCQDCKLDLEIIDLYDIEKMNMFDERLIF